MSNGFSSNGRNGTPTNGVAKSDDVPDITPVRDLIVRTRRILRSTWVVTGSSVTLGIGIITLLVLSLTDLLVPFGTWVRLTALLLVLVPAGWMFIHGVLRPLLRRLSEVLVARRIEKEIPNIHNRLVSCVDLSKTAGSESAGSMPFYRRLVKEALERIQGFHPRKVLDLLSLRRSLTFAVSGLVAFLLAFAIIPDRMSTAMARIFQPFADIPPASGVLYDVLIDDQTEPGTYETLRGEDLQFRVVIRKGEVDPPGGTDPLRLLVNTVDDEGQPKEIWYDFGKVENQETSFVLTGLQESFTYRVFGGGTYTREQRVVMLDRPQIVGLQTAVFYPAYMRNPEPRLGPPQTVDVAGPIESSVEIRVDVTGDASEGEIQLLERQLRTVAVKDRPERTWFSTDLPDGAKAEGTWEWDEQTNGRKLHSDPKADGVHGHLLQGAPIGFEVRPGESLFAWVYVVPDQEPQTIMLKWHDGENWEHRACWGENKIEEGTADTPSRLAVGDIPTAGKLIRLEVPAKDVGLENRRIHGISFAMFGGKCLWGSVGAMPAPTRQTRELVVTESFLLNRDPDADTPEAESDTSTDAPVTTRWIGRFPLIRDGFYRVELRNRIGHASKQMTEGKVTAIPDNPPQVAIERPGTDLLLSEPVKVPVYISSYDDFGLDDVVISVQNNPEKGFQGRPVQKFEPPQRSDSSVVVLDLSEEDIKVGDTLKYRVEVRDTRGQTATSVDYTIRLADDNNAEDRKLTQFTEKTDTFREKLVDLIAQQEKVQESVEELEEKHRELTEKIEQAQAEAEKKAAEELKNNPDRKPEEIPEPQIELDEASKKELAELKAKLAEIWEEEEEAVQLSHQLSGELGQIADQAPNLQTLPKEIAQQLQAVNEAFKDLAVKPMQDLNESIKEGVKPEQSDPKLPELGRKSEQLQRNLDDLKERLEAIEKARERSGDDLQDALKDLRQDMLEQNADIAARELQELKDFIEAMRKDLENLKGDQAELLQDTPKDLSNPLLDKLTEAQDKPDEEAKKELADVRDLLDSRKMQDLKDFPKRPWDPDREEYKVPPKEQDTPEEDPADDEGDEGKSEDEGDMPEEDEEGEEVPEFLPQLGGPVPKLDERFKEMIRQVKKELEENKSDDKAKNEKKEELASRQFQRLEELDTAEQALQADQQAVEELLDRLTGENSPNEPMTPEQAQQLAEAMKSQSLEEAMQMLRRMEQMLSSAEAQESQQESKAQLPQPTEDSQGAFLVTEGVEEILLELDDIDLEARTVIMKMPPRQREDLLQGLQEQGPEGYRRFIREYFRRLTKAQGEAK